MAMIARAQGRDGDAITALQAAADMDASMDKNNVTPGAIVPTRELLGDLLLELDKPKDALGAYEASLNADPNRFRSLYGAAKAAGRAGDVVKAKAYYTAHWQHPREFLRLGLNSAERAGGRRRLAKTTSLS